MALKITSPDVRVQGPSTFGDGSSLAFTDGVAYAAEVSPGVRAYLERRGYTIADDAPDEKAPKPVEVPEGAPTADWSHKQLDAYAEQRGIKLAAGLSKDDKVAALTEEVI